MTYYLLYPPRESSALHLFSSIESVEDLGSYIASTGKDIKYREGKAWNVFWKLDRVWKSPASLQQKVQLFNHFLSKGFPIDELNRLALYRVKSISALSAHSAVKGLIGT